MQDTKYNGLKLPIDIALRKSGEYVLTFAHTATQNPFPKNRPGCRLQCGHVIYDAIRLGVRGNVTLGLTGGLNPLMKGFCCGALN
jgi:hypothetical protein